MTIISKPIYSIEFDNNLFFPIAGFECYAINKNGDIKNTKTNKLLKPSLNKKNKYYYVCLCKDGKRKNNQKIHKLVAETFLTKPNEKYVVDHINNNKTDNRVENLRFVSYAENNRNKTKQYNVTYSFVEKVPENSLHVLKFKDVNLSNVGLYFNKNTDEFYLKITENKYRIMHKNYKGNFYQVCFGFNGKQIHYSLRQLQREYPEYFE